MILKKLILLKKEENLRIIKGNKYENVCDLQSSPYRYDYSNIKKEEYEKMKYNPSRIPNSEWPNNYLKAILEANFDNWSRKQSDYSYPIIIIDSDKYLEDLLIELNLLN